MSADIPAAAVRSEISSIVIRPARGGDAEAIARVRVDSWRETYRGMIPQAYLDAMKLEQSRALWEKVLTARSTAVSVFVAERGAEIVGVSVGRRGSGGSWIRLAHTRGAHRQSPGPTAVGNDFAVICVPLARSQGRGPRAISKRIKENRQ